MRSDYQPFQIRPNKSTYEDDEDRSLLSAEEGTEEQNQSLIGFLKKRFEALIFQVVPYDPIKRYPPNFMFCMGGLLIAFIGFFFLLDLAYLVVTNVNDREYLAFDTESDDIPFFKWFGEGGCKPVRSFPTGAFRATYDGRWEGQPGFNYTNGIYKFTTTNFHEGYKEMMDIVKDKLYSVGEQAKSQDLARNLLDWFSFTYLPDQADPATRFNLLGDPVSVFDRQYVFGTISNEEADCNLPDQDAFVNVPSGEIVLQFPKDGFQKGCSGRNNMGELTYLGYKGFGHSSQFELSVDLRSLMTAIAVNYNVLNVGDLSKIPGIHGSVGNEWKYYGYFDPQYPGMKPIICLESTLRKELCTLSLGGKNDSYVIPFFHHFGNSFDYPSPCICSKSSKRTDTHKFNHKMCNSFNFLLGFLYYPSPNSLNYIVELMANEGPLFETLHPKIFNASWTASALSKNYEVYNAPEMRKKSYAFCNLDKPTFLHVPSSHPTSTPTSIPSSTPTSAPTIDISDDYSAYDFYYSDDYFAPSKGRKCNIVTFSVSDNLVDDWFVNKYYHQLLPGACQNNVFRDNETW
jgi:hypothetical protein